MKNILALLFLVIALPQLQAQTNVGELDSYAGVTIESKYLVPANLSTKTNCETTVIYGTATIRNVSDKMVRADLKLRLWKWDDTVVEEKPIFGPDGNIVGMEIILGKWELVATKEHGDVVLVTTANDFLNGNFNKNRTLAADLSRLLRSGEYAVSMDVTFSEPTAAGEAGENPFTHRYSHKFTVVKGDCNGDGEVDVEHQLVPIQ